MVTSLERASTAIDRKGNTALQGIFPGIEFDHLVGRYIKVERESSEKELTMWAIYNAFDSMSSSGDREKVMREFTLIMFSAFARAQDNQGLRTMRLAGEITDDELAEETSSVKIYSRPEIKGVRVEIHYSEAEVIRIDLTRHDAAIKIKSRLEEEFKEADMSAFLGEDYNPEDAEYTEQQVAIGRRLEETIFLRNRI